MKKSLLCLFTFAVLVISAKVKAQCPTVDAGPDTTVCADATSIIVSMTATNNDLGVEWVTYSSDGGYFADPAAVTTIYYLSEYDKQYGVSLEAYAYSSDGTCSSVTATKYVSTANYADLSVTGGTMIADDEYMVCGSNLQEVELYPYINNGSTGALFTAGDGTFSTSVYDPSTYEYFYYPGAGDIAAGNVLISFVADPFNGCASHSDTVKLTFSPVSSTLAEDTIWSCDLLDVQMSLTTDAPDNIIDWYVYSGYGTVTETSLTSASYTPTADDTAYYVQIEVTTSDINYTCTDYDYVTINFGKPDVYAGYDETLCSDNSYFYTSGAYAEKADSFTWTTSGSGTFDFTYSEINPDYILSAADKTAGSVNLFLTADNACGTAADTVSLTIQGPLLINAGADRSVCATEGDTIQLSGTANGVSSVTWSAGGSGTLLYTDSLNTVYTFGPSDASYGSLYFTLNVYDTAGCYGWDDLTLTINNSYVNAGHDMSLCQPEPVPLSGYGYNATSYQWTSSGSGTFADATDPYTTYTPSAADGNAGSVLLFLSAGNAACAEMSTDTVVVNFNATEIYADIWTADQSSVSTTCSNSPVYLYGETGNGHGVWTTIDGTGTFLYGTDNPYYAEYALSAEDKQRQEVSFVLTPTNTGTCTAVPDTVTFVIEQAPVVDAGKNALLEQAGVQLNGYISDNTLSAYWYTSGTGYFDDPYSMSPVYYPSSEDMLAGYVYIDMDVEGYEGQCYPYDYLVLSAGTVCNVDITATVTDNTVDFDAVNSDNSVIGAYYWDFGDGNTGSGKIQNHVYKNPGTYLVSVNYTAYDSSCYAAEYDTVVVASATKSVHSVSGTVYAGADFLDYGSVSLFKYDGQSYHFLKELSIHSSSKGKFTFANLEAGSYLIFTGIDIHSSFRNKFTPVYYGDAEIWENATIIQVVNSDLTGKDINLNPYTPITGWRDPASPSSISGVVTFNSAAILKATAGEDPVENAVVTLYNSDGDRLTSTYTDPFGNYSFDNLVPGDYMIDVEYPGGTSDTTATSISSGGSSTVNSSVAKQNVTLGLFGKKASASAQLYPNPVSSVLHVRGEAFRTGEEVEITIVNSIGQPLSRTKTSYGNGINVSSLESGLYIIEIRSDKNFYSGKFRKE